jgi:single-strand DNA-binding protein
MTTERQIPEWADINSITLRGRLGQDATSRSTPGGLLFVSFNMATSERWKDKRSGDQVERTEWHNVVVKFNDVALNLAVDLKKGERIMLTGKLTSRKYQDQSGSERTIYEIEVGRFGTLVRAPMPEQQSQQTSKRQVGGGSRTANANLDDEIPFSACWQ